MRRKTLGGTSVDALGLLHLARPLTEDEDRRLAACCRETLAAYRTAVATGNPSRALTARARLCYLHLGGDPDRTSVSLKDYDHDRYGPFLGISDEGSAASAIRQAAYESPKVRVLSKSATPTALVVGLAVDAERLGRIGEVAVGPEEYADIWLACVGRILITTNVGTRVNVRVYRREPRVVLRSSLPKAIGRAKQEITAAFKPFVETPDGKPRPLIVFVDIPRSARMTTSQRKTALTKLATFVSTGKAAGRRSAPEGHALGLVAWVPTGLAGKEASTAAIDLAASAEIQTVVLDGVRRRAADEAISLAGLLDYFTPGIVGPLLRRAKEKNVRVRAANLPDTDTIARSIWVALATARNMGANLGKYGCFPLTQSETDHVVQQVQRWTPHWSAAPVFFVDQGLLREGAIDVERDLPRGIEKWLDTVAAHGVRVALIDTIDKVSGRRLLKRSSKDDLGYLGPRQIERIEQHARKAGVKLLWAGGLGLRDAFEMGKRAVFGIYVTTAAAITIPVGGSYARDPALASVKEPSREGVLRTKIMLEAGFLASKLQNASAQEIDRAAESLLSAVDATDAVAIQRRTAALVPLCEIGWRAYWKARRPEIRLKRARPSG